MDDQKQLTEEVRFAPEELAAGPLPDVIIIGAMKAGTTSLFKYLERHPDMSRCRTKEPAFFSHKAWEKGLGYYQSLYKVTDQLKFEASTNYTKYPHFPHVVRRMHSVVPDAKLIYVVRHPVKRIISQLHHLTVSRKMAINAPFNTERFWQKRGKRALAMSKYFMQISQYLKYYDRSRIYIMRFEDLVKNPVSELNKLSDFLGVRSDFYTPEMDFAQHNKLSTRAYTRFPELYRYLRAACKRKLLPHSVLKWFETPVPRPDLTPETQQFLWSQVEDDLRQFEAWYGKSLGYAPPQ